jgi:uncharacterized protein (DUF2267 family)
MSATGLEVFDRTLQATNIWLDEVMRQAGWSDRQKAYRALRVVLHALRDRLPVDEAAHLSAQLPMLVRGIFFEGWHPAGTPVPVRSKDEFLSSLASAFSMDEEADPERLAEIVFRVLARHVGDGESNKIKSVLPKDIRELWA